MAMMKRLYDENEKKVRAIAEETGIDFDFLMECLTECLDSGDTADNVLNYM